MDIQLPSLHKENFVTFLRDGRSYIVGGFSDIKMKIIGRFLAEDVDLTGNKYKELLNKCNSVGGNYGTVVKQPNDMLCLIGEDEETTYVEFTNELYYKLLDDWSEVIKNNPRMIYLLKQNADYVFYIEKNSTYTQGIFEEGKIVFLKDERFIYKLSVYTDRSMLVLWSVMSTDEMLEDLKYKLIDSNDHKIIYYNFYSVVIKNDMVSIELVSNHSFDSPCIVKRKNLFDLINAYQKCKKEHKASALIVHKDRYDVSWELVP